MTKQKMKPLVKNQDKKSYMQDVSLIGFYCLLFSFISFFYAFAGKWLGFDINNKEFFGTTYILYCLTSIILVYNINKDYVIDKLTPRQELTVPIFFKGICSMITVMILFTVPVVVLDAILNHFGYSLISLAPANSKSAGITDMIYACFLGPICEEIIFRGFVQRRLEKYSPVVAIWISAICFGLFHGNFGQTFPMIGTGLVLGYMAYKYSIKASIAMHISYNLVLGELFGIITNNLGKQWEIPFIHMTPFMLVIFLLNSVGIYVITKKVVTCNWPFMEYKRNYKIIFSAFLTVGMMLFVAIMLAFCIFYIKKI